MGLDTEQLLTFLALAEEGSVSGAARLLHRGQPAVSERLQKLTAAIGEPLYIRHGRGIRLTPTGESLLPALRTLQEAVREVNGAVVRRQRLQEGVLRVAATNTLANYFLPKRLVLFSEQRPGVRIHLKGGITDWTQIRIGDWDLFFLEGQKDIPGLPSYYRVTPWVEDEIVCIAPEGHFLAGHPIDWPALLTVPIIWREPGSGVRRAVEERFAARGLHPQFIMEVTGVEAVGQAVSAGLGVGFVTKVALAQQLRWPVTVLDLPNPTPLLWALYLAAPEAAYRSRAVVEFLALLDTA